MKNYLLSRILFALAFIILIITNIFVLSGVASNRSGSPEAHIRLTERELALPYRNHKENSGLALRLKWRALGRAKSDYSYYRGNSPAWFTAEKLEELGFDISRYYNPDGKTVFYKRPIPKQVFIVLEYDGDLYQQSLERAKSELEKEKAALKLNPDNKKQQNSLKYAEEWFEKEQVEQSRLFAIDAGLDADTLREKYKDRSHFIITKGLVKPTVKHTKNIKKVSGYISRIHIIKINVPLKYRQIFDSMPWYRSGTKVSRTPRFEINLAYGNRFEPWVTDVNLLNTNKSHTQ